MNYVEKKNEELVLEGNMCLSNAFYDKFIQKYIQLNLSIKLH